MSEIEKFEVLNHDLYTDLSNYVTSLTTSGSKTLDDKVMKKFKQICRKSDNYVEYVYHLLMTQIRKDHSEIRYSGLLICNELFSRSHKFRSLLLIDFQEFLQLCAETDPDELLPPPKAAAKMLKQKTLECVQDWYHKFKDGYKLLIIGYNFLKECKQVNFEDLEARSIAERAQEAETRQRRDNALRLKVEKASEQLTELSAEIQSVTEQLENCFRLFQSHPEVYFEKSDFSNEKRDSRGDCMKEDDGGSPESNQDTMRLHGVTSRNISIQVTVKNDCTLVENNDDTSPVLENIRDLHLQITSHLQPSLTKISRVLMKAGNEDKMKNVIDLKLLLELSLEKLNQLKIVPQKETVSGRDSCSEEEDDDFEDVEEKSGLEEVIPVNRRAEYGLEPIASTSKGPELTTDQRHWALRMKKSDMQDPTTRLANLTAMSKKLGSEETELPRTSEVASPVKETDRERAELLAKAPKKNFDIDLYHWEDEKLEPPTIIRFDSLHKFWQPQENETSEFQTKEAEAAIRERVIDFSGEFQPVKWSCRAPLPSGTLCPRKDRKKCPFHGLIIPRDEMGNPCQPEIHKPSTSTAVNTVPDWQDPVLLREIEAQTGINLKIPEKGKRKKKDKEASLTNIKVTQNTTRKRLEKKVLDKCAVKRVAEKLDRLDHKKFRDKYGDQWNYAFSR